MSDDVEFKETLIDPADLEAIVRDPERLANMLLAILQNLTVLNFVMSKLAEQAGLDHPTDTNDLGTGGYI